MILILVVIGVSLMVLGPVILIVHMYNTNKYGEEEMDQRSTVRSFRRANRQLVLLALAKSRDGMTSSELCDATGEGPGTVIPALYHLQLHGLITIYKKSGLNHFCLNYRGVQIYERLKASQKI